MRILFVCTGNICRSPMAEYIALDMAKDFPRLEATLRASSAGTSVYEGLPMSDYSRQALTQQGVPFFAHSARQITAAMVDEADLILTMSAGHLRDILRKYPQAGGKAHTLKGYAIGEEGLPQGSAGVYDIADPYGGTPEDYLRAAREITAAMRPALKRNA